MSSTYRGFFGAEYGVKSTIKMWFITLIIACFAWLIAAGFWYFKILPGRTAPFPIPDKKGIVELMLGRENVEYSRSLDRYNQSAMRRAKIAFRATVLAPIFTILIVFLYFRHVSKKQGAGKEVRGSRLVTPRRLNKLLRKRRSLKYRFPFIGIIYRIAMGVSKGKRELRIGKVKLPKKLETEHCLCVGRPGSGKTTLLYGIIQSLRVRNARAIIYDCKGDYIEKFYDPQKDLLFNPFDKRTIRWSIFNEIDNSLNIDIRQLDVGQIVNSLIPDKPKKDGKGGYFEEAPRDVLAGILLYLCRKKKRTNKDLWDMCCEKPSAIREKFRKVPECRGFIRHLEGGEQSVRCSDLMATFSKEVNPFKYLVNSSGDFSFKDWVENGKGFLFIANKPSQQATLKPLQSLIIDIMLTKGIDLTDDINRRLFLIVDEFGTLQKLPTFVNFLTNSRSKGGSVWCGIQDFGTIGETYGSYIKETFFNSFGAFFCMKVDAVETSSYVSKAFGQREILKQRPTMQVSDDHVGHGSLSENKIEDLILASEITNLNKLEGYLRISNCAVTKTKVKRKEIPNKSKAFEPREAGILDIKPQVIEPKTSEAKPGKNKNKLKDAMAIKVKSKKNIRPKKKKNK